MAPIRSSFLTCIIWLILMAGTAQAVQAQARATTTPPASLQQADAESTTTSPASLQRVLAEAATTSLAPRRRMRAYAATSSEDQQADQPGDTSRTLPGARTYALDEIVVTSQRIPRPVLYSPSAATVVTRREIEGAGGTSLGTILASGTGLFVKDYGGPSGIKTIAQRGLGTEHTLFLVNGMPVNSIQTGGVDLGMTASDDIERIEIVRGGQSALHGPHAVAGIVNVITRTMSAGQYSTAGMDWGSFGYRQYRVAVGDGTGPTTWQLRYGHETSDEDFPFDFRNGATVLTLNRQNADLRVDRWSGTLRAPLSSGVQLESYAAYHSGERGVPGIVAGPFSSSVARQKDQQVIVQASVTALLSPTASWETRLQGQYGYQRYRDPDLIIGYVPVDNFSVIREGRFESRVTFLTPWGMRVNAGGDLTRFLGGSNAHREDARRTQWGVAIAGEQQLFGNETESSLALYPALRYDRAGRDLDAWSPQLGMSARVPLEELTSIPHAVLRVHGNASRNFRPPTFNELYYSGGGGIGNPSLKPERSTSFEAGGGVSFVAFGEHHLDVTLFDIGMRDRIIWVAAGSGIVTPKNLRDVRSRGLELAYVFSSGGAAISIQYTRSRSEKTSADYDGDPNTNVQLPYLPQEMAGARGSYLLDIRSGVLESVECSGGFTFVSHRFVTEDNGPFLPGYRVFHAGAGVRLQLGHWRARVSGEVGNLLNASYEVMPGYPMPLRNARLRFDVSY